MANLTEAASVGQIQEELDFHTFMLSTVDAEDEEAAERASELNETIQHLQSLLEQKQRPSTPHTATALQTGSFSGNLPSRSRAVDGQNAASSPLGSEFAQAKTRVNGMEDPFAVSSVPLQDGGLGERKRQSRGSMDLAQGQPFSKAARPNTAATASTTDTNDIIDLLDDSDDMPPELKGMRNNYDQFKKRQLEMERQFQREKMDQQMAQSLSMGGTPNYYPPSSSQQGAQRHTQQAFLDRNGSFHRPKVPTKPQQTDPSLAPETGPVTINPQDLDSRARQLCSSSTAPNGIVKPEPGVAAQQRQISAPQQRPTTHNIDSSDSSDGFAEISASEFAQVNPRRHQRVHPSLERANAAARGPPAQYIPAKDYRQNRVVSGHPGNLPGNQPVPPHLLALQNGVNPYAMGNPVVAPANTRPFVNEYGQTVYLLPNGQPYGHRPYQQATLPSQSASQYPGSSSWYNTALSFGQQALANVGQWASGNGWGNSNPYPNDYSDEDSDIEELSYRRKAYDFNDVLRDRGLMHMLNDPQRDREELQKLLENIRPDEELPEELMKDTPPELTFPLMPHQKLGLTWLQQQEDGSHKGGILADDMGLGKTIQALALMVTRPSKDSAEKTTLIIAPVALLKQWQREIKNKIRPTHALRTLIFHGTAKKKYTFATLCTYDVILTTFGTVAQEFKRLKDWQWRRQMNSQPNRDTNLDEASENFPLLGQRSKWYRIIIDEAQCIKNKSTVSAQAAAALKATYRLCMSGTPMMNGVAEMYSLIHFLSIPPYNDFRKFQVTFGNPLKKPGNPGAERAMTAFQALLKAILLRRTKKSTVHGKPILQLRPRIDEKVHSVFSQEQQEFYDMLEKKSQVTINRYMQAGTMLKNYSHILTLLLRLRQCCDHPDLVKDQALSGNNELSGDEMINVAKQFKEEVVTMIKEANGNFECPICYDASENPTIFFPCGHDVCTECFARLTDPSQAIANGDETGTARCPECRNKVNVKQVINYTVFKKVHQPEIFQEEHGAEDTEQKESESDSESDSEDDDSDVDSQGDLRDFIVYDDAEESEAEDSDDGEDRDNDEAEDDVKTERKRKDKGKKKAKATWKGKARATGSEKKKAKKPKLTLAELKKQGLRNASAKKRYLRRIRRDWQSSAKVDKVMEILQGIRAKRDGQKTLIFSLWTSMLDLLEVPIDDEGFKYCRYDGSMSAGLRDQAVSDFDEKPEVTVMLVSLKAGNAGLNLTSASQVIILDPFWNPFTEEQAIDRAHRIGQTRDVYIHRILVRNTVEDRIEDIKDQKRDVIEAALDEGAAKGLSRLSVGQLAHLFGLDRAAQS